MVARLPLPVASSLTVVWVNDRLGEWLPGCPGGAGRGEMHARRGMLWSCPTRPSGAPTAFRPQRAWPHRVPLQTLGSPAARTRSAATPGQVSHVALSPLGPLAVCGLPLSLGARPPKDLTNHTAPYMPCTSTVTHIAGSRPTAHVCVGGWVVVVLGTRCVGGRCPWAHGDPWDPQTTQRHEAPVHKCLHARRRGATGRVSRVIHICLV